MRSTDRLLSAVGFSVFSSPQKADIASPALRAKGVTFRSHLDGAMVQLTPERAIDAGKCGGLDRNLR
jgi:queuine/archaeosine tRNA-ribosyltransferase